MEALSPNNWTIRKFPINFCFKNYKENDEHELINITERPDLFSFLLWQVKQRQLLTTEHSLPEPHYCHCRPPIIQMVTPDKVLLEVIDTVLIPRNITLVGKFTKEEYRSIIICA